MNTWTERDGKRLRAAAEHEGVTVFADVSAREALRLASAALAALTAARKYSRYRKAVRRKRRWR